MQEIKPFLMFAGDAEEAKNFYVSLFPDSEILSISRYGSDEAGLVGTVKHATFKLNGLEFMAIDSSEKHGFSFTSAMSMYVSCKTVTEIEELYSKLSKAG